MVVQLFQFNTIINRFDPFRFSRWLNWNIRLDRGNSKSCGSFINPTPNFALLDSIALLDMAIGILIFNAKWTTHGSEVISV